ncbi:hypothetical protein ACTXT7_012552 [Hymenolepis weldensis]
MAEVLCMAMKGDGIKEGGINEILDGNSKTKIDDLKQASLVAFSCKTVRLRMSLMERFSAVPKNGLRLGHNRLLEQLIFDAAIFDENESR